MEKTSVLVTLPSKGLPYKESIPELFESGGEIEIYPLTARDEKMLAGGGGLSIHALMNSLFSNTIKTQVDVNKLLSSDRFFILMQLRIHTWGGEYPTSIMCENCRKRYNKDLDLANPNDLMIKFLEDYDNTWTITLPRSGDRLELKLLTGNDELEIDRIVRNYKKFVKTNVGDPSYIARLMQHIVTVNDKEITGMMDKFSYVENLLSPDVDAIRQSINTNEPGYDLELITDCTFCGEENRTILEFTTKFFRPGN